MTPEDSVMATGYRYFAGVAEAGSVRGAARVLNVAASAISRQIGLLEAHLGIPLFERQGRTLKLSDAGEVLLRGLKAVRQGHEATLDTLGALKGLKRGTLRIATVESVSVAVLPGLLEAFIKDYPGIRVAVTVAGSDAVTDLVREHEADIGFTFNPATHDGLDIAVERGFPIGATMAPTHPLANAGRLGLADCLKHRIAWPAKGLSLRAILDRALGAHAWAPAPAIECNSLRLMASLARSGTCIAFQTRIGIEQDIAAGRLVFVPLSDRRLELDRLMLVRRASADGRPASDAFLAHARRAMPTP